MWAFVDDGRGVVGHFQFLFLSSRKRQRKDGGDRGIGIMVRYNFPLFECSSSIGMVREGCCFCCMMSFWFLKLPMRSFSCIALAYVGVCWRCIPLLYFGGKGARIGTGGSFSLFEESRYDEHITGWDTLAYLNAIYRGCWGNLNTLHFEFFFSERKEIIEISMVSYFRLLTVITSPLTYHSQPCSCLD